MTVKYPVSDLNILQADIKALAQYIDALNSSDEEMDEKARTIYAFRAGLRHFRITMHLQKIAEFIDLQPIKEKVSG